MPATPQPDKDDAHQQLLDQMDTYYLPKPFRSSEWKPTHRRNKNIKQILSEAQRREASVLATQNNSGASTPLPQPSDASGTATPQPNMAQATQSLSTLVLERNLQKAINMNGALGPQASLGPAVTYTNIENAPSLHAAKKHYCDITGLPARYTDPKTKLRYYNQEIFGVVRTLPPGGPDQYLAARGANRIKGAIDSRIAEEQARQARQQQQVRQPPKRRTGVQNGGTPKTPVRQREATTASGERGSNPDPSEFEPEFAIGTDDSAVPSRIATPQPDATRQETSNDSIRDEQQKEGGDTEQQKEEANNGQNNADPKPIMLQDLPVDVKTKLRKLERLESKYAELLRAYRTAHSRVQAIEPFEAALRENTPLTSISDPSALTEYLNQTNLKSDMVLEELKRVSIDRDEFKKKLEASEKENKDLHSENNQQKAKLEELSNPVSAQGERALEKTDERPSEATSNTEISSPKSNSSRIPSISLFSPKTKPSSTQAAETSEDLFSYDSEVPRLEAELEERQSQIEDLSKQITALNGDLKVARESTDGMMQTLENTTRELNTLKEERDRLESAKSAYENKISTLESAAMSAEDQERLQAEKALVRKEKDEALSQSLQLQQRIAELEKTQSQLETELQTTKKNAEFLNEKLGQKDHIVKDLEDSLAMAKAAEREQAGKAQQKSDSEKRIGTMQSLVDNLRSQLSNAEAVTADLKQQLKSRETEFANKTSTKVFGVLDEDEKLVKSMETLKSKDDIVNFLSETLVKDRPHEQNGDDTAPKPSEGTNIAAGNKKKNKKKKKGKSAQTSVEDEPESNLPVKVSEDLSHESEMKVPELDTSAAKILELEDDISKLKQEVQDRDFTINKLSKQIKDQEALQEEIETLRDDLLHQGEEHVEARDALKTVQLERQTLTQTVDRLETELAEAKIQLTAGTDMQKSNDELVLQIETLKTKSATLETDLAAAEQLATARFKDITDLRELLNKAQPELRNLRKEVDELKNAEEELKNKKGELSRLEIKHEEMKDEMKNLGRRMSDQDATIKDLQQKIDQEEKMRLKVENELSMSQSELRGAEARVRSSALASETTAKELSKAKEEGNTARTKLRDMEEQLAGLRREIGTLKEEVSLKTALHSSSQSLVQSLRDQVHEINIQARESSSRAESLEEELTEAQRMLSERTREGQTMRMLLNQTETGTEGRLREMKERMDTALEERDRIEDETNVNSRRMMREMEDAKSKARDAQRQQKILEDEKDELENRTREWKRRREELENSAESAQREVEDIRSAMKDLREALDESERQVREAETRSSDLKRHTDEATERIEKLSKANKNLTEEVRSLQTQVGVRKGSARPGLESGLQSSRTSIDSGTARSPAPTTRTPTSIARTDTPPSSGPNPGNIDYVYLKNVLLQFLTQRDKGHQRQLIPVLAMLLHFDQKDEQKWNAAISAR